jgi:hypothetical protein
MKITGRSKKVNVKEAKISEKELKKNKTTRRGMESIDVNAQIQEKAYELFERRGYEHGCDQVDWIEAEKEIKNNM